MFRIVRLGFSVFVLLVCVSACEKSAEPSERADRARLDGLMPGATPRFDPTYVVNQADVKVLPERTISYEPLDVFRVKNAEARAAQAAKPKADSTGVATKNPKSGDKPSGQGMIGRLKARLFGGLLGDEAGAAPDDGADDAATDNDDSDASDGEDEAEDDAASEDDDEATDEEEADDEASDDDESEDDEASDDSDESEDEDDSTDEDDDDE